MDYLVDDLAQFVRDEERTNDGIDKKVLATLLKQKIQVKIRETATLKSTPNARNIESTPNARNIESASNARNIKSTSNARNIKSTSNARNIVQKRNELMREFFSGRVASVKKCVHCQSKKIGVNLQDNLVLVVSKRVADLPDTDILARNVKTSDKTSDKTRLTPTQTRDIFRKLWEERVSLFEEHFPLSASLNSTRRQPVSDRQVLLAGDQCAAI